MQSGSSKIMNKASEKKYALVVAPNFLKVHFKMNSVFANALTKKFFVHFLILNTKNEEIGDNFDYGIDLEKFEEGTGNTYQVVNFPDDYPEKLNEGVKNLENKFIKRGYEQSSQILKNEAFTVYKDLFENNGAIVHYLKEAKFDLGVFDTWDTGALFILHAAGIKNVFGINNIQLNAYQFKYAGKEFPKNIPEIYSAQTGDNELSPTKERKREIAEQYEKSFEIFSAVHNDLNTWYARIDKSGETVQNLYSKIKGIFLNGHQLFDFPLGENKPKNVFYVGGIHLKEYKHEQESVGENKQVIISIEYCKQIAQPETIIILEKLVDAFENVSNSEEINLIYDCKAEGEDLENLKQVLNLDNHVIKKIPEMQEELAKGNTLLLITNGSGYQVTEAFYENVPILTLPYIVDQFYVSEALKITHEIEIENFTGKGATIGGSRKHVNGRGKSPHSLRNKSPPKPSLYGPGKHDEKSYTGKQKIKIDAPTLSFNLMLNEGIETIEEVLKEALFDASYKANVNKVHQYLRKTMSKDNHSNPKNIFLEKINEVLHKSDGGNGNDLKSKL
uniref:glucuronosyltransferase n=1 Tax=Meloidogyne incognita TaxID=6306 RepID=A0A914LEZ1_MELIC